MKLLPARLPLVIGATGHRDLQDQDVPRLEQEVAAIITTLRRDYLGDDMATPIIILSALAEGADRLVARVALKQGALLIAPLPMPIEEYRRDFDGDLAEFEELFAQAISAPVMPLQGVSLEAIRTDQDQRNEQYRKLGVFITRHCHVLLALWDGSDERVSPGGTAEVVSFKRDGIPLLVSGSPRISLDVSAHGPVIEIMTPRLRETSDANEVFVRPWGRLVITRYRGTIVWRAWRNVVAYYGNLVRHELEDERARLSPAARRELESWEQFQALINLTCKFNRDAARLAKASDGSARLAQSLDHLFTDGDSSKADADARSRAMECAPAWCKLHAIADVLALERQSQFKWDWKCLMCLGFIAFICFALFPRVGYVWNVLFLVGYLVTFAVGAAVYFGARLRQDQERYLDYRALAEALRIVIYWTLIGIGRSNSRRDRGLEDESGVGALGLIANACSVNEPGELAWVKVCLRTLEWLVPPGQPFRDWADPVGHAIIRRFWVQGQLAYFKRQSHHHYNFVKRITAWSHLMLLLPNSVLVPMMIYLMLYKAESDWHGVNMKLLSLVILSLLTSVAAVFVAYSERLALSEQARQYDRMRELFGRASDLLPNELDDRTRPFAHALYQEIGMEAMKENAEWVSIYRQRPIKPPY